MIRTDDFFIGYRPMPPDLRRFTVRVALVGLVLLGTGAATLAFTMAPSLGMPTTRYDQAVEGVLGSEPYGVVWTRQPGSGALHGVLLVRGGKFGFVEAGHPLAGRGVRVAGQLIERDGTSMLELGALPEGRPAIDAAALSAELQRGTRSLGEVTLRGVMEDSKCYLGRMRPGVGQPHRACAQLCVRGGIPPVLVTRDGTGQETAYLVATRDGRSMHAQVLDLLAEPVEVRGRLVEKGDLRFIETDLASIRRL